MSAEPLAKLTVNVCSRHGARAVMLDVGGHGLRLTPGKCCGSWDQEVYRFLMTARDLREASEAFLNAADTIEHEATLSVLRAKDE